MNYPKVVEDDRIIFIYSEEPATTWRRMKAF